ncbi:haloacid dehalogenase [Nocardioides dokdonensis FR1436]|uniref:Haloacid dehalogenase n=1 Tax=Nocardioides dokdonensis FR1436 TaxID=1300347 RepID=A0A1A9GEW0_9ACTN|nr:HAD-IA family hydrolase [Nocardioides dokdonensis]ANH36808.1 haloacid dehalogenase [Nocardioides dokdonensis FR1436]
MPVEHVLLDADGVLQRSPHDPFAVLRRWVGARAEELAHELWAAEKPALRGEEDFLDVLTRVLPGYAEGADPAEVHAALWLDITVDASSLALARRLREQGAGVHLATNQHRQRGEHMRTALGYDDLFDVSCYSWELGAAKPDPAYFERALDRVGAPAHEVLLVDDSAANVEAAREAGLRGVHWHLDEGHEALRAALLGHGLDPGDR